MIVMTHYVHIISLLIDRNMANNLLYVKHTMKSQQTYFET